MNIYVVMEQQSNWSFDGDHSTETEVPVPIRAFATRDEAGDYIATQNSMRMSVEEISFGPQE